MHELQFKGSQQWCEADVRAYNSLQGRWRTNPKLRAWWNSLTPKQKQCWFTKWQGLDPKRRFDLVSYVEKTILAQEIIDDEVYRWIPYEKFRREKLLEKKQESTIEALWTQALEEHRFEARQCHGKWLLPRFEGLERRSRTRYTQEQDAMRTANVTDAQQMAALWAGGQQLLDRYKASFVAPTTLQTEVPDPHVTAVVADMPHQPLPQDVVLSAISREVCQLFVSLY